MMDSFAYTVVCENVEHILLGYLSEQSQHGYGLIKRVREDHSVYLSASTVYPALQKLEEKGLVMGDWDLSHERPRRVYEITDQGRRELERQRTVIRQVLSTDIERAEAVIG